MDAIDVSAIILAVIGMASGWFNWWLDRRKHRQEVNHLEAENRQMYMDLAKEYVEEFRRNIGNPLQDEVVELRKEVKELKDAVEGINDCRYRDECPVRDRLASPTSLTTRQGNRKHSSALAAGELQKQPQHDKFGVCEGEHRIHSAHE